MPHSLTTFCWCSLIGLSSSCLFLYPWLSVFFPCFAHAHHFSCCSFFSAQTLATGGNGYINDFPMGRFLRDAKLYEIGAGTSEVRRLVIGRAFNADFH